MPTIRPPWPIDPDRVRDNHDHASHSGGVTNHCHLIVQETPHLPLPLPVGVYDPSPSQWTLQDLPRTDRIRQSLP